MVFVNVVMGLIKSWQNIHNRHHVTMHQGATRKHMTTADIRGSQWAV